MTRRDMEMSSVRGVVIPYFRAAIRRHLFTEGVAAV